MVDDAGLIQKRDAFRRGIEVNHPNPEDGLGVLAKVGGFEIVGIAGSVLASAFYSRHDLKEAWVANKSDSSIRP